MEQETTWQWRCDIEPDRTVVTLLGEIDMAGADHLRDVFYKAIAQAPRVDVDLAQLTFHRLGGDQHPGHRPQARR